MKKFIIGLFTTLSLISCNFRINNRNITTGKVEYRPLRVVRIEFYPNLNVAKYYVESVNLNRIVVIDTLGKFQVGDTVELKRR